MPFNVLAYSSKVMVGGNTIGIQVQSKGIMIIGFYKVSNRYNKSDLKQGDYITKVNDDHENYTYTARFNLKFESAVKLVASVENASKLLLPLIEISTITESKYRKEWGHA